MTSQKIKLLSQELGANINLVKQWYERWKFDTFEEWKIFFKNNKRLIKAKPFVKWVGGKRQILDELEKLFPKNFNNYFEPFVWWGAVFFTLQNNKSYLSDLNENLINAYKTIKYEPKKLINFLKTLKYEKEFYYEIRKWDRSEDWPDNYSNVERAWRFLYLNRTCFNGLYRVNKKNQFNVPIGRYKNPNFVQEENLLNVSKVLNKMDTIIERESFENILEKVKSQDFVYLDPPYDTLSDTANFTSYTKEDFDKDSQKKLAKVYKKLDQKWAYVMLSNHNTPLINNLYKNYKFKIIKAKRSINSKWDKRWKIDEVVIINY